MITPKKMVMLRLKAEVKLLRRQMAREAAYKREKEKENGTRRR